MVLLDNGGGSTAALDSELASLGSADGRCARDEVGALDGRDSESGSGAGAHHLGGRRARCHDASTRGGALRSDHLGGNYSDENTIKTMC